MEGHHRRPEERSKQPYPERASSKTKKNDQLRHGFSFCLNTTEACFMSLTMNCWYNFFFSFLFFRGSDTFQILVASEAGGEWTTVVKGHLVCQHVSNINFDSNVLLLNPLNIFSQIFQPSLYGVACAKQESSFFFFPPTETRFVMFQVIFKTLRNARLFSTPPYKTKYTFSQSLSIYDSHASLQYFDIY